MRIGYARVSTIEQHEDRQIIELQEKADVERTFLDKLSGKNTERPELRKMIDFAREGDTIYASELMRICGCSRPTIYNWLKESGVAIQPLKWKPYQKRS